jgi:tRNA(fMet)-specific endonuclease VapC
MKGDGRVWSKFMQYSGRVSLSTISVGELYTWALRANAPPSRLQTLLDFLKGVQLLDVTEEIGRKFGEIHASLLDQGRPTPRFDLFIACTALVHGLTVVTHNIKDFAHVPGLTIEDWTVP